VTKCTVVQNRQFRNIDNELPDPEKIDFEAHLQACPSCRREYRILTLSLRLARGAAVPVPSPFFYSRLRANIESEAQQTTFWQSVLGPTRHLVSVLAVFTLVLLSVFAYLQLRGSETDLYRAYERVFVSEEQPSRMLIAGQGEITDESVLSAIADREAGPHRSRDLK
jgi:anti-sigma factor RsiW